MMPQNTNIHFKSNTIGNLKNMTKTIWPYKRVLIKQLGQNLNNEFNKRFYG